MNRKMKVSVVVPVYNNEAYIEKCIESIISQTYDALEIIIVNDGSTDSSGVMLERFAAQDDRILLISQDNKGVSSARNAALRHATGDYLLFVDGDDFIGKDYIATLVECANNYEADMVVCGLTMVDIDGKVLERIIPGDYIRNEKEEWTFRISAVAAHLYHRNIWEQYNIFFQEGERGEDMPISLFFAGVCERIKTLQKADYYYVQHSSSAMHNFQGLKSNKLPYQSLEDAISTLQQVGIRNSREFHELFVLRILCTCINLAKGADKTEIEYLSQYIQHILTDYYPDYYKNKKAGLFSGLDIPFRQRVYVKVLIWVQKIGILPTFLRIVCK